MQGAAASKAVRRKQAMAKLSITRDKFDAILAEMDKDKDGQVTKDEFAGPFLEVYPDKKDSFEEIWTVIDSDQSGTVTCNELAKYFGIDLDAGGDDLDGLSDEAILEALQLYNIVEPVAPAAAPSAAPPKMERLSTVAFKARRPSRDDIDLGYEMNMLQLCDIGTLEQVKAATDAMVTNNKTLRIEDDKGELVIHKLARRKLGETQLVSQVREMIDLMNAEDPSNGKKALNHQDNSGRIPLHYAAEAGNSHFVSFGLDRGADPAIPSKTGWTVLHHAVNAGSVEIVKTIMEHTKFISDPRSKKVLIETKDKNGRTPLHIAAFTADEHMVQLLIAHGADKTQPDAAGNNPANLAARTGRRKSREILEM
jgi:Ca2+-binding EF-hand superfamily protein